MKIAHLDFGEKPIFLAPMEDVSDPPFRVICKRYGADLCYTEFISSGGLVYDAKDSVQKLEFYEEERPVGIQLFGGNPDQVKIAAQIVDDAKPDLIDINYGCPVKKVVCHDGGSGILRNLEKMQFLTEQVLSVATRPVTVKTRLGWNDETINVLQVAKMLEDIGIQALAIHARTRAQMYTGNARWEWLKRIKEESGISIPLIGNGDASTPELIKKMFDETGVDGVMVGRGAIGNPWIFREAKHYLQTGELPPPPSWEERISVIQEHLQLKAEWLGERKGTLEMRRMYGGYFKGFRHASYCRQTLMKETTLEGAMNALTSFLNMDAHDVELSANTDNTRAEMPIEAFAMVD